MNKEWRRLHHLTIEASGSSPVEPATDVPFANYLDGTIDIIEDLPAGP